METEARMELEGRLSARRRAGVIARHMVPVAGEIESCASAAATTTCHGVKRSDCLAYASPQVSEGPPSFCTQEMRQLLDIHDIELRDKLFALFSSHPLFLNKQGLAQMEYNSTMEEQRDFTMKRIEYLVREGYYRDSLSLDPAVQLRQAALGEAVTFFDHSQAVKAGVHFGLWGVSLMHMGTARHQEKWRKATEDLKIRGCFALTELGHGSNVRGIETTAVYDRGTQEFIINTPCESAQKFWIGGAATHATHTVAFAQLDLGGEAQGVHAFIVPLRDPATGSTLPGIRIKDCGHKMGLNGVDNGRIWFDNVRVPRDNMLNAVADVSPDGVYSSKIKDADQRFAFFMAPLTGGRVSIVVQSVIVSKVGLSTALRYAMSRRAFSPAPGAPEVRLLDYPTHRRRLLPLLARTYAHNFAANDLKLMFARRRATSPEEMKLIHVLSSGYKAVCTWHMSRTLQECREACGGQGFKTDNRIGQLKSEHDVMLSFEGDNNVLLQQVSKSLLGEYASRKKKALGIFGLDPSVDYRSRLRTEKNGGEESAYIRSYDFQLNLLRLWEKDLLQRFAAEFESRVSAGESVFDAFNNSYVLANALGRAHTERTILERFQNGIQMGALGHIQEVLELLRSLYILTTIEEHPDLLRYEFLTPAMSMAIQAEITSLCEEVRPHTLALLDSWAIPRALLGPIAFDWVEWNAYARSSNYFRRDGYN